MSNKSRKAYAIIMKDSYFPAVGTEIFYVANPDRLPSHAVIALSPGWYHQERWSGQKPHGAPVGPFHSSERAEDDIFS